MLTQFMPNDLSQSGMYTQFLKENEKIFERYKIIFKSCVDGADRPKIILFGEHHNDEICLSLNGSTISLFANVRNIVVCEESRPSFNFLSNENKLAEASFLRIPMKGMKDLNRISFVGWDINNIYDLLDINKNINELKALLVKCKNQVETFNFMISKSKEDIDKNLISYGNYDNCPKNIQLWIDGSRAFISKLDEILLDLTPKVLKTIQLKSQKESEMRHKLQETFPLRTKSMVETIQAIVQMDDFDSIFVIAGTSHLWNDEPSPKYGLELLYDELKTKNAMVLVPNYIYQNQYKGLGECTKMFHDIFYSFE